VRRRGAGQPAHHRPRVPRHRLPDLRHLRQGRAPHRAVAGRFGPGLRAGDALGIRHRNPEPLVEAVLQATGLDADAAVTLDGQALPLAEALATGRELTRLSRPFLVAHADLAGAADLKQLLAPGHAGLAALLGDHQVADVLRRWPAAWSPDTLLAALRPQ